MEQPTNIVENGKITVEYIAYLTTLMSDAIKHHDDVVIAGLRFIRNNGDDSLMIISEKKIVARIDDLEEEFMMKDCFHEFLNQAKPKAPTHRKQLVILSNPKSIALRILAGLVDETFNIQVIRSVDDLPTLKVDRVIKFDPMDDEIDVLLGL